MAEVISLEGSFETKFFIALSVDTFKKRYLPGLPLPNSIDDKTLEFYIESAQSEVETLLGIRLSKTYILGEQDFSGEDWVQWGYIKTIFPVIKPISLEGYYGTTRQINYPSQWLSVKRTNDNKNYSRTMSLVPNRNASHSEAIIFSGLMPHSHFFSSKRIPDYWLLGYITGWDVPPAELVDLLGKLAASKVLQLISDALMAGTVTQTVNSQGQTVLTSNGSNFAGIGLGMSSKSISIDGLSQSFSSYVNGQTGLYGATLKQYAEELDRSKPHSTISRLYDAYGAIVMGVC